MLRAVSASAGPADGCDEGPGRIYESPSAFGMKKMFERAYMDLGVPLHRVRYMGKTVVRALGALLSIYVLMYVLYFIPSAECHATGTQVGDLIELSSVGQFFGVRAYIFCSSSNSICSSSGSPFTSNDSLG